MAAYARGDRKVAMFLYQEGEAGVSAIRAAKGDLEVARTLLPDYILPEEGLARVAEIRATYDHPAPRGGARIKIDKESNVAYAVYNIDGKTDKLIGVSGTRDRPGTVEVPTKRRYETGQVDNYTRANDSEVKILEEIASHLEPDARGIVQIFSEVPVCESCAKVITQFEAEFKNVKVVVSQGPKRINP